MQHLTSQVLHNVDIRQPTYEQLRARVEQLESVVQECERLAIANRYAAAVMHEVNNPLEAITNLVYLMQHEEVSEGVREHLSLLQDQLAVLTAVTRPSLSFHRDQQTAKTVDLKKLVESVKKLHAERLSHSGIVLEQRCSENASCDVIASELLQVLSNLVLNAVEALSETRRGTHIHIRVRRCTDCVHVIVADDGPGIPEHLEQSLFQAYSTGRRHGSGLGLWISERIVQRHKGSIRCRTSRRPGRSGTCFRIFLPCSTAA